MLTICRAVRATPRLEEKKSAMVVVSRSGEEGSRKNLEGEGLRNKKPGKKTTAGVVRDVHLKTWLYSILFLKKKTVSLFGWTPELWKENQKQTMTLGCGTGAVRPLAASHQQCGGGRFCCNEHSILQGCNSRAYDTEKYWNGRPRASSSQKSSRGDRYHNSGFGQEALWEECSIPEGHESEYQDTRCKLSRFRNTIVLNTMAVASVGRQKTS